MIGRHSRPAANGPPTRSRLLLPNESMPVKTEVPSQTKALFDEEQQFIAPGVQTIALLSQLAIARGSGATLTDLDGRTYLDLNAGVSVASLGHAHPRYIAALTKQLEAVTVGSFTSAPRAELVREIAGQPAAIVIEPIQGTAGNIVPPPAFLREVCEVAHEYGALLLADEMITGFGRTGELFGCNHDEVVPDIMTLGKGMASGFPVSALVSTDEIMTAKPFSLPSASSSSYGGNPLAAAAALITIQTILADKLVENSDKVGRLLQDGFEAIAAKRRSIANVRGRGLLVGFDLVADKDTKNLLPKEQCIEIFKRGLAEGLIMMNYTPRVRVH